MYITKNLVGRCYSFGYIFFLKLPENTLVLNSSSRNLHSEHVRCGNKSTASTLVRYLSSVCLYSFNLPSSPPGRMFRYYIRCEKRRGVKHSFRRNWISRLTKFVPKKSVLKQFYFILSTVSRSFRFSVGRNQINLLWVNRWKGTVYVYILNKS